MTALSYELEFWGDCLDTLGEENKHLVYAPLMGIGFNLQGRSVVDIGAGPVSMLLKCEDFNDSAVVDPLLREFPSWVRARYREAGIAPICIRGEDLDLTGFDEAWIYNVLTHTDDPGLIIENARAAANWVRIFEWLEIPARQGHPQTLHFDQMNEWLGGTGMCGHINQNGAVGLAYWGAFPA